jgi:transposase
MRIAATVNLTDEQLQALEGYARRRATPARVVERSNMILLAAQGKQDIQIAEELGVTRQTVSRWRKRFVTHGIAGILEDAPRSGKPPTITQAQVDEIVRVTTTRTPPCATHWSTRSMARHAGVSEGTVRRIWHAHGLKPHRIKTFKLSNDPAFAEKLEDIVGLYLSPPEHALVFSCDEKSQIQALDRTQPSLPMKKGRCGTMTHDYIRNGTTTLFAALNTVSGKVIGTCMERHRHQEWLKFLKLIDEQTPPEKTLHLIVDNYATHKHPKVKAWLARHPRFVMHFTPTSASWLNMVERFFRDLTVNRLRRDAFPSLDKLLVAIEGYISGHNCEPKPIIWTAKAADILEKVKRARAKLDTLKD